MKVRPPDRFEPITKGQVEGGGRERHPLSDRFHEILEESGRLHDAKSLGYGLADDPFANVRATERWGCPSCHAPIPGWLGALIRGAGDKVARLQAATLSKDGLPFESMVDSMDDLLVYTGIAKVLYEQENDLLPQHIKNRLAEG